MMKKRVLLVVLALVMVMAFALTACGAPAEGSPSASASESASSSADTSESASDSGAAVNEQLIAGEGETYYMVTFASTLDFWKMCYQGFQEAAALYGATTQYTGTTEQDATEEANIFNQVVGTKPAGVAMTCVNAEGLKEPINAAIAAGVPVVCFDSDSPDSDRLSFVACDNYNAGRIAGEALVELAGDGGTISGTLVPGQQNLEDRWSGIRDYISETGANVTIVDPVNNGYNQTECAQQISALMTAHPEINALFACSADAATGVAQALKEMNKTDGSVSVLAFDTEPATLNAMEEGLVTATLVQGRFSMGWYAFHMLYWINHEMVQDTTQQRDWTAGNPLPSSIDTGCTVVYADQVDALREDWSSWEA